MKFRIESVDSWGKHVLDVWVVDKWEKVYTGYYCEVEKMRLLLERAYREEIAKSAY